MYSKILKHIQNKCQRMFKNGQRRFKHIFSNIFGHFEKDGRTYWPGTDKRLIGIVSVFVFVFVFELELNSSSSSSLNWN